MVMNSKMPKGVEHIDRLEEIAQLRVVMNSKMPKGVEHGDGEKKESAVVPS